MPSFSPCTAKAPEMRRRSQDSSSWVRNLDVYFSSIWYLKYLHNDNMPWRLAMWDIFRKYREGCCRGWRWVLEVKLHTNCRLPWRRWNETYQPSQAILELERCLSLDIELKSIGDQKACISETMWVLISKKKKKSTQMRTWRKSPRNCDTSHILHSPLTHIFLRNILHMEFVKKPNI